MGRDWKAVCKVSDIPLTGARVLSRAGQHDVALFRNAEGAVFALLDRCPHRGGPLSQGIIHGDYVTCPLHNWNIALATGNAVSPDEGCVRRYSVWIGEGQVFLDLNELQATVTDPA